MKKLKQILGGLLGTGVVFLVLAAVVIGLSSLGGSIMRLFGLTFTSGWKVVQFFVLSGIIGFPLEVFAKALPRSLLSLQVVGLTGARVLFLVLDTLGTVLVMSGVDYMMKSVSATTLSMVVIGLLMAVLDLKDIHPSDDKPPEG